MGSSSCKVVSAVQRNLLSESSTCTDTRDLGVCGKCQLDAEAGENYEFSTWRGSVPCGAPSNPVPCTMYIEDEVSTVRRPEERRAKRVQNSTSKDNVDRETLSCAFSSPDKEGDEKEGDEKEELLPTGQEKANTMVLGQVRKCHIGLN